MKFLVSFFIFVSVVLAADKTTAGPVFVVSRDAVEISEKSNTTTTTTSDGKTTTSSEVEKVNSAKSREAAKLELAEAKLAAKVAIAQAKATQPKGCGLGCMFLGPPVVPYYAGASYYGGGNSYVTPYGATYSNGVAVSAAPPIAITGSPGMVHAYGK